MADTPPPPSDNPYENGTADGIPNGNGQETIIEEALPQNTPGVAAKPGKALAVLGVLGAIVVTLVVMMFSGGDDAPPKPEPIKRQVVAAKEPPPPPKPKEEPDILIEPPPLIPPLMPDPVDLPEDVDFNPFNPEEPAMDPKAEAAAKEQALARLRSAMVVKDDKKGGVSSILGGGENRQNADPDSQFAAEVARTKTETVVATRIADLRRTIAQGRIIQATMESALNTDLAAPIRAIVSRDTYAEAGHEPLIPKGSRLIGRYNTTLTAGQTRVFVVWTRVIRPDGVDVALGSPLIDQIGQAGVSGQVDSRFQEIFARALVSSVINIATAIGTEEISGQKTTTTTNSAEGGSQTTGSPSSEAITNALNRLGSITDGFIQRFVNVKATILIDQGTPVNVFVNKDIVFPSNVMNQQMVE